MTWLYETRTLASEKNGDIKCQRALGRWTIYVKGTQQTSPYVTDLWRTALKRIPRQAKIRRILVLGLGAGGCIAPLMRRFPHSHIVGVEWDQTMVTLLKDLKIVPATGRLEVVVDDVVRALPELTGSFDLILFDLFTGSNINERLAAEDVQQNIGRLLAHDGSLVINAFAQPDLFEKYSATFDKQKSWKYLANDVALFGHKEAGLLDGYVPYRASAAYLERECSHGSNFRFICQLSGACGIGWNFGPLKFEKYYSDVEPTASRSTLCIWQPITRQGVPLGWWRSHIPISSRFTGYVQIAPDVPFESSWSNHAQRQLAQWQRGNWQAMETPLEDFLKGVADSTLPGSWKESLKTNLPKKLIRHGNNLKLFGVRDDQTGRLLVGLAVIDIPEIAQSVHLASFINNKARQLPLGVGLIHHWHQKSLVKNIRFLDFDQLWAPGEPKTWQGFSTFKHQFGLHYVRYPKTLIRLGGF